MADESSVNSQVTDSVTQVDTLMLANSASESMSLLDLVTAETLGMSMHNAVSSQQNSQMSASAAVTATCAKMLAVSPPPEPKPTPEKPDVPPPFMPLESKDAAAEKTTSDLVKEATEMAEKAINMIEASDNKTDEDVTVLQGLMNKIKTLTSASDDDADAGKQKSDADDSGKKDSGDDSNNS